MRKRVALGSIRDPRIYPPLPLCLVRLLCPQRQLCVSLPAICSAFCFPSSPTLYQALTGSARQDDLIDESQFGSPGMEGKLLFVGASSSLALALLRPALPAEQDV